MIKRSGKHRRIITIKKRNFGKGFSLWWPLIIGARQNLPSNAGKFVSLVIYILPGQNQFTWWTIFQVKMATLGEWVGYSSAKHHKGSHQLWGKGRIRFVSGHSSSLILLRLHSSIFYSFFSVGSGLLHSHPIRFHYRSPLLITHRRF